MILSQIAPQRWSVIREGLMSTKYYEKTIESLRGANRSKLKTKYKLSKVNTCNPGIVSKRHFYVLKIF